MFLTHLPISAKVTAVLARMLEADFGERTTLRLYAIERVSSFYSDGVIFDSLKAAW
jgi:hypothetical protein